VNWPWWLTESGALPGAKRVNAASGTMVEAAVLTAAPVEVPERVELASWLEFWLRAAAATDGPGAAPTVAVVGDATAVSAVVAWVPLSTPPEVLT